MLNTNTTNLFLSHFGLQKQRPTLNFLTQITHAFSHIPYENATKILKKHKVGAKNLLPLRYPEEVLNDYFEFGTGGTCFSLTFLLHHILESCDFVTEPLMADRSYGKNTHCALRVGAKDFLPLPNDQYYFLDPGFLLNKPVHLVPGNDTTHPTSFNQLIFKWSSFYQCQVYTKKESLKLRYILKWEGMSWDEFQRHWIDSFNWSGMNSIIFTTLFEGKQIYIHNDHMRIISPTKVTKQKIDSLFLSNRVFPSAAILQNAKEALLYRNSSR